MLISLLAFIVAIGVVVTLHELGHYLAARACGVHVEKFSFGFGQSLLRRYDKRGTEWAISAIPLGGYVRMRDTAWPGASQAEQASCFENKSLLQRAFIVFAGPLANFLLAVFFFAWIGMLGITMPAALLGTPDAQSPAALAGVQQGDRLLAIDGKGIDSWGDVRWQLLEVLPKGGDISLQIETAQGDRVERNLYLPPNALNPDHTTDPLESTGLTLAQPKTVVEKVLSGAGERAGLQAGDVIVQAGELHHPSANSFIQLVQQSADQPFMLQVLRGGQILSLQIQPDAVLNDQSQAMGKIAVVVRPDYELRQVNYGLVGSVKYGIQRTYETVKLLAKMMFYLVSGDVSTKNLSGPIGIADQAGQTAKIGLVAYLSFIAMINVSMGILNLLPIPMLDGGHLLYYAIEAVRGRPLSLAWQMATRRLGFVILAALTVFALFNDVTRLFS
ncbi:RIP metalloprotease RseP [Alcaligenes endophyticus]